MGLVEDVVLLRQHEHLHGADEPGDVRIDDAVDVEGVVRAVRGRVRTRAHFRPESDPVVERGAVLVESRIAEHRAVPNRPVRRIEDNDEVRVRRIGLCPRLVEDREIVPRS